MSSSIIFPATSSIASALAHYYGGAYLNVDAVVADALLNGTSSASLTTRQLYDCAVAQYAEKTAGEAGKLDIKFLQQTNTHSQRLTNMFQNVKLYVKQLQFLYTPYCYTKFEAEIDIVV